MARRSANDVELLAGVAQRLPTARGRQGLANPFRDREAPGPSQALDLALLGILQDHLQTLSHTMSLDDSSE